MRLANFKDYQLKQMEIKTADLNAPIEEVVIKQPEGFELLDENSLFVNWKSLYGLNTTLVFDQRRIVFDFDGSLEEAGFWLWRLSWLH